ncbi:MAG: hypothetical protein CMN76_18455 [Spirochaetaceae bacterium]|nr:hypothetical protein [Spirochaetaceae bacterium]|tara:strand:- start:279879 stop:280877 length:999 start_codon:yes stop_codon:yes gene_type:complete
MKRSLIFAILFFASLGSLFAEAIYMRNGEILVGTITQQTERSVTVIIEGRTRVIPKSQIARITFETEEEIREIRRQQALERQRRLAAEKRQKEEAELERARQQFLSEQAMARAERARYLREQVEKGQMEKPDEPISYFDFAWRSALVPGWGHVAIGRPYIGYTYMALSGLALYNLGRTWGPAHAAKAENQQQIDFSTALALAGQNSTIPSNVRFVYFVELNRRATAEYQAKVDDYNYAVMAALTLYGAQLAHIIFNGFAWEKGLVVENDNARDGFSLNVTYGRSMPGKLPTYTGLELTPGPFAGAYQQGPDAILNNARRPETSMEFGYTRHF